MRITSYNQGLLSLYFQIPHLWLWEALAVRFRFLVYITNRKVSTYREHCNFTVLLNCAKSSPNLEPAHISKESLDSEI
jgi:hypothetical protein